MRLFLLRTLFAFCILIPCTSLPAAETGATGQEGKVLHETHCISCHTGMFGGDGSAIYTRADRKVHSLQALEGQVSNCNHNLGLDLDKGQLANILAYLNQAFYKFEK